MIGGIRTASLVVALALCVWPGLAMACSCSAWQPETILIHGDIIAEGTVMAVAPDPSTPCEAAITEAVLGCPDDRDVNCWARYKKQLKACEGPVPIMPRMKAEFRPTDIWKGSEFGPVTLSFFLAAGGNCGISLSPGDKIAFVGFQNDDGQWSIDSCSVAPFGTFSADNNTFGAIANPLLEQYRRETEVLREAVADKPDDVALHLRLAAHFAANGDRPNALAAYRQIIVLAPDDHDGYVGAAHAQMVDQSFTDALETVRAGLQRLPDDPALLALNDELTGMIGKSIPPRNIQYRGLRAPGLKLAVEQLQGWDFSGAVLTDANFALSNLDGAAFKDTALARADFYGAHLRQADFTTTTLSRTEILEATQFSAADLAQTKFSGRHIRFDLNHDASEAITAFAAADLNGASLTCSPVDLAGFHKTYQNSQRKAAWRDLSAQAATLQALIDAQPGAFADGNCRDQITAIAELPQ